MKRYCDAADALSRELGAHVTSIHHTPWSEERGKGAIDLDGVVDVSFIVRNQGGKYSLTCDGANDQDEGLVASFTMQSVDLGTDSKGKVTTAPVVIPCEPAESVILGDGTEMNISPKKGLAAKTFEAALAEAGQVNPHTGQRGVHESELRKRFRAHAETTGRQEEPSLGAMVRARLGDLERKDIAEKIGEWFYPLAEPA